MLHLLIILNQLKAIMIYQKENKMKLVVKLENLLWDYKNQMMQQLIVKNYKNNYPFIKQNWVKKAKIVKN